jgi:hypothetical protein
MSDIKWNDGDPPRDGKTYLFQFASGIICSGQYRLGEMGEPCYGSLTKNYRCDCCGRFATPVRWARIPNNEE